MTELDRDHNEEYKVEAICDSAIYTRESKLGQLLRLYYLISWKHYPKDQNNWEPVLAIPHLQKLISLFYKNHLNKPAAISEAINTASLIGKSTI